MNQTESAVTTTAESLSNEAVDFYQKNGFVKVPRLLTKNEAEHFYQAAIAVNAVHKNNMGDNATFSQNLNVWIEHESMRKLSLHTEI